MPSVASVLIAATVFAACATSQATIAQIVGTWTTKSQRVLTGPGFYDPTNDTLIEPSLTGISYSFTADGFYEEALYRAIPNPVNPNCPQAIMQWQHGSYIMNADSTMQLTPIAVDGRQLFSDPCVPSKTSSMTRYNQPEGFTKVVVQMDTYNHKLRLNLYGYNGNPVNPMWQNSTTPIMLPTTTLHPNPTATATRRKRSLDSFQGQLVMDTITSPFTSKSPTVADRVFLLGLGLTCVGSILVFYG